VLILAPFDFIPSSLSAPRMQNYYNCSQSKQERDKRGAAELEWGRSRIRFIELFILAPYEAVEVAKERDW